MTQIDHLYRLQQLDDEIRHRKDRLSTVIRLQKESDELIQARERVITAEEELKHHRSNYNDLTLELNALNNKAKRSEERLYSGLVKNPKELADIQQEIDSLGKRRSTLEDEVLEAMILLEEAESEYDLASSELDEVESSWEQEQIDLQQEQEALAVELVEMLATRKHQVTSIGSDALTTYENTKKFAGTTAVVVLRNDRCQGCQVRVPENLIKEVDQGQLIHCDSCGRLLYLE
jgi:predicted  nucleic acid-binding Zn-ribbon protein